MQINNINWNILSKDISKEEPEPEWQTGDYARRQEVALNFPDAILCLTKVWGIDPIQLAIDFLNHLSGISCDRKGRDKAKEHLVNYISEMGYGQQDYTPDDIKQMLSELDAMDILCPQSAENKMVEAYITWSKTYLNWWFKKWQREIRRGKD